MTNTKFQSKNAEDQISNLIYTPSKDAPFVPLETFCGLFPIGEVSMITAQAGVGKSWLMRYAMNQASVGQDIFGNDSEVYSSLCFNGELSEHTLSLRDRLTRNCVYDTSKISYITTEALMKQGITPALSGDESEIFKAKVQEAVKALGVKAVFFDSLVSFNGGDENSTKDMSALCGWLLSFAKSYNVAVVLSHHLRKQGKEKGRTIDDVAGSSAMIRLCQTVYYLENSAAAPAKGYVTRLLVRQLRNASLVRDPFIFTFTTRELDTGEISTDFTAQSYTEFQVKDADGEEIIANNQENRTKKQQVHTAIKGLTTAKPEATSSDIRTYVQDVCNLDVSEKTINEAVKDMRKNKELIRLEHKRGQEWVYVRPAAAEEE